MNTDNNPYREIKHSSELKGFLKPFKGKGEMEEFERLAEECQVDIYRLMAKLIADCEALALPNITLMAQRVKSRAYLRWRNPTEMKMGLCVLRDFLNTPNIGNQTRNKIQELEHRRNVLNFQSSCLTQLSRRAEVSIENFKKMEPYFL
jgi:hypothetical protein